MHLHKKKTKAPHPVKIKAKACANKYARYISCGDILYDSHKYVVYETQRVYLTIHRASACQGSVIVIAPLLFLERRMLIKRKCRSVFVAKTDHFTLVSE